ncbi:MAG: VCBS repeat-containing protein [Candidatus Zixiibacteriota bacterium]
MKVRFTPRTAIAGLVLAGSITSHAAAQDVCLGAPRAVSVGNRPVCVIAANLNGDDYQDLVVANSLSDNISVILGSEFGGFEQAINYPSENLPLTVTAADLDGDLDIDLAVGHDSGGVGILLNTGAGVLSGPYLYPTGGASPGYVAIADLDGDLDRDLAVANRDADYVSVLMNNGNGTFGAAVDYGGISTWPRGIVAVDLDGDLDVDLAVGSEGFARVDVLKNNGDGTFGGQAWYATGTHPWWVVAEDVDKDGDPDLIASGGTNSGENFARVLLNAGNGTFSGGASYACGDYQRGACTTDLNGDSWPDIVVAVSQSDYIAVLMNDGAGGFLAPDSLTVGGSPYSVTAIDVDGDLDMDVAVALADADKVAILLNDGAGDLITADSYRSPGASAMARSIALADIDGDHDLDLLWVEQSSNVQVIQNSGSGELNWFSWDFHETGAGARYIAISDVDLDSDPDVIVANGGESSISILENDGGLFFNWPRTDYPVGATPIAVGTGLFNADAYPDIAVANLDDDNISVLIGAGDGTFGSAVNYFAGGGPQAVVVADLTGDDIMDLAVPCYSDNYASILTGIGDGTFFPFGSVPASLNPKFAAAGDFDQDLDMDLAIASESGGGILVCRNNGLGGFADSAYYTADSGLIGIIAEDLTGDGILDLAATSFSASVLNILVGAGDGTFSAAPTFSVGYDTRTLCAGDLDDDGDLDIATASWTNSALHIVRNCGYASEKSVTNLNDWGPGSLRQAINAANSSPGYTAVYIEAGGILTPLAPLPSLEDDSTEIYPVDIAKHRLEVPALVLDGSLLSSGHGLEIASSFNSVSGIEFRNFPENGIAITGATSGHNAITGCRFHNNGGLAIDLGDDGVTPNDPGDTDAGPNTLVNYPTIDTVFYLGADTFYVAGQTSPDALVEIHLAEQYLGADTIADPSGHGEGWRILDAANADGAGRFVFERLGARRWCKISAVATDADNNTSEFSPNRELIPDSLIFTTYSPVTMVVIEPDLSDSIGPGFNTIGPTASYDSTSDWGIGPSGQAGESDDRVVITNVQGGDYIIKVRPNAGASGDGYFFGIRVDGTNEVYASIAGYLSPVPVENPLPAEGTEASFEFPLEGAPRGDLDGNKLLDAVDLALLIDIVFFGAGQPDPPELGDINCDSFPDAVDLAILIDHVFFGGAEPCR